MCATISCCINNLTLHQYGDNLQELAVEGMEIRLERCLSQCAGPQATGIRRARTLDRRGTRRRF